MPPPANISLNANPRVRAIIVSAIVSCLLLAGGRLFADATADSIRLGLQLLEWQSGLAGSVKTQIEAGETDPKAIRKKATADTQPQETKLRATMQEMGLAQRHIEERIKDDRATYLEDVEAQIKAHQKKTPKKSIPAQRRLSMRSSQSLRTGGLPQPNPHSQTMRHDGNG